MTERGENKIKKRIVVMGVLVAIVMTLIVGCGESGGNESQTQGYSGRFSGPAGSMSFSSNGEVRLDFSDDHSWDLYPAAYNTTHRYKFVTQKKEVVSYDRAEYLNLMNLKDGNFFALLPCKVGKDKITLYPGVDFEAIFDRAAD